MNMDLETGLALIKSISGAVDVSAAIAAKEAAQDAQAGAEAAQAEAEEVLESILEDYSELSDDVSDLKSRVSATEIVVQSDSQPIVQIADGSANNAKSYDVQITPAQDLHGYDHPWPAGGGKNVIKLYDADVTVDGVRLVYNASTEMISVSGTNTNTSSHAIIGFLPTNAIFPDFQIGDTYTVFCDNTTLSMYMQFTYTSSSTGSAKPMGYCAFSSGHATFTVPDNFAGINQFQLYVNSVATTVSGSFHVWLEKGTVSSSTFSPYSNICPISGWTGAEVKRRGRNLIEFAAGEKTQAGVTWTVDNNGTITSSGTATTVHSYSPNSEVLALTPGTYTASFNTTNSNLVATIQKNNAWYRSLNANTNATFTVDAESEFNMYIYAPSGTNANGVSTVQIEIGSTATSYEPYSGADYSISFPQSAGTVYGGSLHVNADGSGTLVVDKGYVDLGTLSWGYESGNARFFANLSGIKASTTSFLCGVYKYGYTVSQDKVMQISSTYIYIKDTAYSDATTFKAAMDGVDFVYELATPQTYTLTAPQIALLLGTNNIWADAGNMAVEYIADTKLYIQTLTGHPDEDMTADANITSGNFFMIGNTLYLATANIANGSAVVPGTNCTQMSLAAALNSINA